MTARRGLTDSTSASSTATGVPSREEEELEEGEGEEGEVEAVDEAAAKRAALLKRYGDRTPPAGPVAVKATTARAGATGGFDVEKSVAAEVNHNEIWGDCKSSLEWVPSLF